MQVSLLHEDTSIQPPMPTSGDSTVDKGKGKQALTQNTSPSRIPSSPQSTPTTSTAQPPHTQPRQENTPCSHQTTTSMVTRWIPKDSLQAQGYFQGEKDVWLPRQPRHQKPTSPSQSKPRQRKNKKAQHQRRTHQQWVPVLLLESQGFHRGNDQIWVPKRTKTVATNKGHQDKKQPMTPIRTKMVWVRKDRSAMDRPCPSSPTRVSCKRAEPQEPTWRRVTPKSAPQKVEPQEPALSRTKGKTR